MENATILAYVAHHIALGEYDAAQRYASLLSSQPTLPPMVNVRVYCKNTLMTDRVKRVAYGPIWTGKAR